MNNQPINDSEVGHFTRETIPLMKALVKKRWLEGNPICVNDPMEYMIPYWIEKLLPIYKEELKNGQSK